MFLCTIAAIWAGVGLLAVIVCVYKDLKNE
jgi:hypothetical protein